MNLFPAAVYIATHALPSSLEGCFAVAFSKVVPDVCRAVAVHPGYGFLSENAAFVDACEQAGIAFLGPCAATMRMFSRKHTAREFAEKAGCPVLSGSSLLSSVEEAAACAEKVRDWCSDSAESLQTEMQPPVCQPYTSKAGSWRPTAMKSEAIGFQWQGGQ